MGYLVIGFRIRHNNTGPCGFKLQALQKGVIMQTNCLLQQYTCSQAKTQSAVTAWCSGLHCFLLFHRTVAPYWNTPRPPAPTASLSIKICLQTKGAKSLFFPLSLFWRIWSPLRRCLVAFTTVQFKGSLTFFFFYVQQHLETLDRLVLSFSKDHKKKGRFLTTDTHSVGCGITK